MATSPKMVILREAEKFHIFQFSNPSSKKLLIGSSTEVCVVDTGQALFQLAQGLMAFNAASNICIPEDQST